MRIRHKPITHAFETALDEAARDEGTALDAEAGGAAHAGLSGRRDLYEALEDLMAGDGPPNAESDPRLAVEGRYERETAPEMTPEDIRRALAKLERALLACSAVPDLQRLRRRFAHAHHPDRVPAELRTEAAATMARANALIDRALAAARRASQ